MDFYLIDHHTKILEVANMDHAELERDKEQVYAEERRNWETVLASVIRRHLPTRHMTIAQIKETIEGIRKGAIKLEFVPVNDPRR
ncbi:MAG: hypothetical protein QW835_07530 [Candidatus Hadarchaeum sp.]